MKSELSFGSFIFLFDKMRIGKILCVDTSSGRGYIKDENEQAIEFLLTDLNTTIAVGSFVQFEIKLTEFGLLAKSIIAF